MEVTNDIIFSTNLFQNEKVKLTYKGYLFKGNSTEVSIVYGYGDNWENTTEQPMKRTLNGFTAELDIPNYNKINFCFKNSYNEWDNNNYQDYHADILPHVLPTEASLSDYSDGKETQLESINEKANLLDEILGEYTLYFDNREEFNFKKFVNNIVDEIIAEAAFTPSLAEDVVTENTVVNAEITDFVNYELSAMESAQAEEDINNVRSVSAEHFNKIEVVDEIVNEVTEEIQEEAHVSIEKLSTDFIKEFEENVNYIKAELSSIEIPNVEEIDNSINNFSSSEENLIESAVAEENVETGLVEYEANKFIVAARKLTPIYKFQKRVRLFFYKAFNSIPKILSEQFGFNSNENK